MNEATVRFRVKLLVEMEIIFRFSDLLNPRKIGFTITGVIMVKIFPNYLSKLLIQYQNLVN